MPSFFANNATIAIAPPYGLPRSGKGSDAGFEKFGTLYKHCKGIHLPQAGAAIRLGTISEYRRIENDAVRDKHEGTFRISLNFPRQTRVGIINLRRATLDTSPLGAGTHDNNLRVVTFNGDYTTGCVYSTDSVTIEKRTEEDIYLSGTVNIFAEGADAYVLCLSRSNTPGSVIRDPEYNAIWSIRPGCVLGFVRDLSAHLHTFLSEGDYFSGETIGPFHAPGFSPPPQSEYLGFGISSEIWQIIYRDRTIEVKTDITEEIIRDIHQSLDNSAIIKPLSFSHEEEVRVLFRPVLVDKRDGKRYLFPNYLKPALVPFEPFLGSVNGTL